MQRRKTAFTLIELLVVIAIIAILAAILFPVFAQARGKARQASAISNFKQLALAMIMYREDYDEVNTPGWQRDCHTDKFGETYRYLWQYSIMPYVKSKQVFVDNNTVGTPIFYGEDVPGGEWSYSFWYTGIALNWYEAAGYVGLVDAGYWGGTFQGLPAGVYNLPDSKIQKPAERITLLETTGFPLGGPNPHLEETNCCGTNGNLYWPQWLGNPPGSTDRNAYYAGGLFGFPLLNAQMVLAFYDGHAKTMNPTNTKEVNWDLIASEKPGDGL